MKSDVAPAAWMRPSAPARNAGAAPTRRGRRLRCGGPRGVGRAATSAENGRAASQAASSRLLVALLPPSSMTFAPRVDILFAGAAMSNW